MQRSIVLAVTTAVLLTACGGGGGHGAAVPQGTPASNTPRSAGARVTVTIPAPPSASGRARRPQYISSATNSMTFTPQGGTATVIPLTPTSPGCTAGQGGSRSCTVTVSAPVGPSVTFKIALFASIDGTGTPLATATTTQKVTANQDNPVDLTLGAVVSTLQIALSKAVFSQGTADSATVTVNVLDAAGKTIVVGTDSLVDTSGNPVTVTLADSDTSGATSLSTTTLGSGPVTLNYNGGAPNANSYAITATAASSSGQVATVGVPYRVKSPHLYVASIDTAGACHIDQHPLYNGSNGASFTTPSQSIVLTAGCGGMAVGPNGEVYVSTNSVVKEYAPGTSGTDPNVLATTTITAPGWFDSNMQAGPGGTLYAYAKAVAGPYNKSDDVITLSSDLSVQGRLQVCDPAGTLCPYSTGGDAGLVGSFVATNGDVYAAVGITPAMMYRLPQPGTTAASNTTSSIKGPAFSLRGLVGAFAADGNSIYEFQVASRGPKYQVAAFPVPTAPATTATASAQSGIFATPGGSAPNFVAAVDSQYIYVSPTSVQHVVWAFPISTLSSVTGPIVLQIDATPTTWTIVQIATAAG